MYSDALFKEASGLNYLEKALGLNNIPIKIPQVHTVNEQTMVLEHISQWGGSKPQWQSFGQSLAQLHLQQENSFGWHQDNYIGLNPQINGICDDWGEFYMTKRLAYQISLVKQPMVQKQFRRSLLSFEKMLTVFLNEHCSFSSLLHGDLWSGNVLFDQTDVWMIDPAIYWGDAEADLAMTELFGGFPAVFYQAYAEVKPLSKHYALKKVIYNLYHQLNHYNLFGVGYLPSCERGFRTIENFFN